MPSAVTSMFKLANTLQFFVVELTLSFVALCSLAVSKLALGSNSTLTLGDFSDSLAGVTRQTFRMTGFCTSAYKRSCTSDRTLSIENRHHTSAIVHTMCHCIPACSTKARLCLAATCRNSASLIPVSVLQGATNCCNGKSGLAFLGI